MAHQHVRICKECPAPLGPFDLHHCPPCGKAAGGVLVVSEQLTRAWWVR